MSGNTKPRVRRAAAFPAEAALPRPVIWSDPAAGAADAADEVAEILVMFSHIERCVSLLPADDAGTLARYADCAFRGFDARCEPAHFTVARVMVEHSGFFDEFQERELDSAMPMLARYRQLFGRYESERRGGSCPEFDLDQLRRVLSIH